MRLELSRSTYMESVRALSPDLVYLYTHRVLLRLGLSVSSVFTVVLIYQFFDSSFFAVALAYGSLYIGVLLLTPLSSMLISRLGVMRMLMWAVPLLGVGTIGLYAFASGGQYAFSGLVAFVIAMVLYKILYWVPYHVDFSRLLDSHRRGGQLAIIRNLADVLIVLTPFLGGYVVEKFGFTSLYALVLVFVAISIIPLFSLPNTYEKYQWTYLQTFKQLFSRRNRGLLFAYTGDGVQDMTFAAVWPLIVFTLLGENYIALGAITALTFLAVLVLRMVTGRLFDTWDKKKLMMIGAISASTGWILKIMVGTPVQIFMVDTYHGMGRVVNRTTVDAITYEQSADNGRYVDEYTTLKEMALAFGRTSVLVVVAVLMYFFDPQLAFIAALALSAVATMTTMLLTRRIHLV